MKSAWALLAPSLLAACMGSNTEILSGSEVLPDPEGVEEPVSVDPEGPIHDSFALLLNDERSANGVTAVIEDSRLNEAAMLHATDMVENGYLSHTSQDGRSVGDRADAVGYNWSFIAENIARGFSTETGVVNAWMDSPSHRENMVDPRAEDFGLARVNSTWVLMLGAE